MDTSKEQLGYWISMNKVPGIGPVTFRKLLAAFGSIENLWHAQPNDLAAKNLDRKLIENILQTKLNSNPLQEIENIEKHHVKVVTYQSDHYPELLKHIYNAPVLLFYQGQWDHEADQLSLAVVGTRHVSQYGKQVVEQIVTELVGYGMTIISGLALGIDTYAHETTLKHHGRTIAVLGNGLDFVYPFTNKNLAEKIIAENGLIISEYPLGTEPLAFNFPQRNRIISGLSLGTLVIEAGEESGALITAAYALEQNREVFAVPGSIFTQGSKGCNTLIKQNQAKLVSTAKDILEELNLDLTRQYIETKKILPDNSQEEIILNLLATEPVHIDTLIQESKLGAAEVNSIITLMLLKGKIKDFGNNQYMKAL